MSALKNWLFRSKLTTRRCSRSARFQYRFACLLLFCPATALAAHAVSQGTCETPLIAAIHHRDFAQVKKIIDSRQDLDAKGCEGGSTPLIESIALNEPEVTERLVLSGANPNLSDGKHDSPLTVAAWYCRLETVPLLLAHGAEVNAVDVDGYSALMNSVQNCDDGRVSALLLGCGAKINATTRRGDTALTIAAFYGNEHVVHVLVGAGADLNTKTKNGETALTIARDRDVGRKSSHDRIYEFLLQVSRLDATQKAHPNQ